MTMRGGGDARPLIDIHMQSRINRKEKEIYPFRVLPFRPNLTEKPLTGKFYARHDFPDPDLYDPEIEEAIKRHEVGAPKDKYEEPQTASQEYGWFLEPLVAIDRNDRRFYHPKIGSWITRVGAIIAKEDMKNPNKGFSGAPFKI